jgi:hypothetical protein
MRDSSSPSRIGAAVIVLYVVVATATISLAHRHVRPLFEGTGPSAPYRWVKPPAAFAIGNVVPQPSTTDVPLDPSGSKAIGVTTEDGQLVLNLPVGAMAANGADTGVRVALTPLDPATMPPVPSGLVADGNAYRVQLAYQPSGSPAAIRVAGNIILTVPTAGTTLLFSPDGTSTWQKLATQPVGGPTVIGTEFTQSGWFLGAAIRHKVSAPGSRSSSVSTVLLAAITAALALAIFLIPMGIRRLRTPRPAPTPVRPSARKGAARTTATKKPPARKGKKRR